MKKQILCVALVAAFLAGGSNTNAVATYTLVSTYNFPAPNRTSVGGEFCQRLIVVDGEQNSITSALNRAKREGEPADALLNPNLVTQIGCIECCVSATGTPVGVRLMR